MWNDVNLADDNAGCNSVGSGSRSIYLSQLVLLPWFLNFSTVILFLFDDSLNWKFDLEKSQQFQNGLALFLEIPNVFLLVYAQHVGFTRQHITSRFLYRLWNRRRRSCWCVLFRATQGPTLAHVNYYDGLSNNNNNIRHWESITRLFSSLLIKFRFQRCAADDIIAPYPTGVNLFWFLA
jgi:hypothetical protein